MMQKEKILKKSVLVAAAAASLIAAPTVVKAAEGDTEAGKTEATGKFSEAGLSAVSVDASNGVLTATAGDDAKEILVGTGKVKIKKGESTGTITVSSWDVYEPTEKKINVDLSKLKNTVDNYLVLQTNKSDGKVAIVKIPVKAKYTKVKYDAGRAVLQAGYGATSKDAALEDLTFETGAGSGDTSPGGTINKAEELEYRTAYSQWFGMTDTQKKLDLKLYQENGTQLYIRLKAEGSKDLSGDPDGTEKLAYDNQTAIGVYQAPSLPGKEVKVTIAAKAKGPTISADFTSGTVKIPKKTEYRLLGEDNKFVPEALEKPTESDSCIYYYRAATDGKAQSIDSVFTAAAGTGTAALDDTKTEKTAVLEVRKAATAKKAASKWTRLEIKTLEDMGKYVTVGDKTLEEITTRKNTAKTDPSKEYKGQGIILSKVYEGDKTSEANSVFAIAYTKSKTTNTVCDSIQITNKGVNDYEIYIGTADPNTTTDKIKKTKVSGKGTRTEKVTKITKLADLSQIWIRRAGDKKNKVWATTWTELGVIDYDIPATTPAQSSGTGGAEEGGK